MKRALEDVKILDLTHVWFGPFATMLLADLGAQVIKVEPTWGEMTRFFPPLVNGVSPNFVYFNRNKKDITINLKSEKGRQILKELVKKVDVVVENFSPGTMEKLGLGYEELRKVKPDIIYAFLSGYGQYGPYHERPSFDIIGQAISGLMRLTGDDHDPEGPPIATAQAPGDLTPALFAVISILAAVHYKNRTGEGQKIDVAQGDCMVSVIPAFVGYALTGMTPKDMSRKYFTGVYGTFKTSDGYVVIGSPMGGILDRLTKAIGAERIESRAVVDEWTKKRTSKEVVDTLALAGVPVNEVLDLAGAMKDPHLLARDMFVELEHPRAGKAKVPNFPVKLSETPGRLLTPAPELGQHNEEILTTWLGYTKEEVAKLKQEQAI